MVSGVERKGVKAQKTMWLVLMLLAMLLNGCEIFGLRILAGMGYEYAATDQYVLFYYLGGLIVLAAVMGFRKSAPNRREVGIGAVMATCSIGGTISLAYGLSSYQVAGNVAYPIANGGSLFMVIAGGVLLFRERLGRYGIAGCILGTLAIVLLSIS